MTVAPVYPRGDSTLLSKGHHHTLSYLDSPPSHTPLLPTTIIPSSICPVSSQSNMSATANPFNLKKQLAFYGAYHTDPVNVGIHIIGVPSIIL